jgi:hypothetical protein
MEQIAPIVATLNIEQKLSLIEDLVSSIRKEGGIAPKTSKAKGKKADGDAEKKPKKKAALGTLAWTAYVKHMKQTRPEEFEGVSKESEKLVIIKGIRAENPEDYVSWTNAWKAEHKNDSMSDAASVSDSASVTSDLAEEAPVAPVAPVTAKKPSAKEVAQAKAAEKAAAKTAATAAKEAEKAAKEAEKVAKEAEKAAAKAAKPAKKPVKTAKKAEEDTPKREIDGVSYWHHPENNGLWEVLDGSETFADGCGAWMGYFQPGNDVEPIRFTKAFGSDEEA